MKNLILVLLLSLCSLPAISQTPDYSINFDEFTLSVLLEEKSELAKYFMVPADFEDASLHMFEEDCADIISMSSYEDAKPSKIKDDEGNVIDVREFSVTWKRAYFSDEMEDFTITFIFQEMPEGLKVREMWIPEPF